MMKMISKTKILRTVLLLGIALSGFQASAGTATVQIGEKDSHGKKCKASGISSLPNGACKTIANEKCCVSDGVEASGVPTVGTLSWTWPCNGSTCSSPTCESSALKEL